MDLWTLGSEGLQGLDAGFPCLSSFSGPELKLVRSNGLLAPERHGYVLDDFRSSKMAKTLDFSAFMETGGDRLQRSETIFSGGRAGAGRNEVHESLNHGVGLFTQSQWMELGNQALIYKYITSNVPVPVHLILPIRKALHSAASSCFSGGFFEPTSFGWGSFHNADPEPGRCRRTDGKKWRCSREAVADQKYCERHINRGRHRSRKPVEGLTGHSVAGNSVAGDNATKLISFPAVVAGGESHNTLALSDRQQTSVPSTIQRSSSLLSTSAFAGFFTQKHQISFQESERTVSSESLFNPCSDGHQSAISWPDLEFESELTQLTMSSSFEKPSESLKMNMGTGRNWESSIGGPLGEVLHQTNNNGGLTIGTGALH